MRTLPKTKDEWIGFCLVPCKVYVLAASPVWFIMEAYRDSLPIVQSYPGRLNLETMCLGYILALGLLLIGALLQSLIAKRADALWTVAFLGAGLLLFATLSPWHLITG